MRIPKKISLLLLASCLAGVLLVGCGSEPESETATEDEIITVQRGDLIIDVISSGNLALSHKEDLAFEVAGTVEAVLVEEGDVIEEGQVLAKLDISEWEDNIEVLEDNVTAEERDLVQAQISLQTAEQNLKSAQDSEATKELALLNAQISLDTAEYNLGIAERTIIPLEAEDAQQAVDEAKARLDTLLERLDEAETDDERQTWTSLVRYAQRELRAAYAALDAILGDYDSEELDIKRKQIEAAEMSYAQAQKALDDIADDVAVKELQLTLAQGNLVDAQKALEDAGEALEEALEDSPEIIAPFDGFITSVNVEGGDEVLKGTVAVQIADPNKFEADILVNEMDILQVMLEGEARVEVEAMQGVSFPAEVAHISPTATIQSGVVNYEVTVELTSLIPLETTTSLKEQGQAGISLERLYQILDKAVEDGKLTRQEADAWKTNWEQRASDLSQEQLDEAVEGLAQLLENATREQIEQMQERIKQATENLTEEQKQQLQERYRESSAARQQPEAILQQGEVQLREGLTVTVSIVIEERKNVFLVPNKAIIAQGQDSFVRVMKDGTIEQRSVQTGLSDWQSTEITEGLSEGEQVVISKTTSTSTTQESSRPRGMFGGGG